MVTLAIRIVVHDQQRQRKSSAMKYHYVLHYPDLLLDYGPLVGMWCIYSIYSRNLVKVVRNFKNICSTLSTRHKLLQIANIKL